MILDMPSYQAILSRELENRQKMNPRFSMRALASKLGMAPPALSEILNGKRGLSKAKATILAERLGFNPFETDYFVSLVEATDGSSQRNRLLAQGRLNKFKELREKPLHHDTWQVISEWYHLAILELSRTSEFKSEPQWIAKKLGLDTASVREAIQRLLRLGILRWERTRPKTLVATGQWLLTSPNEIPSKSIRKFHSTILKKADAALELQPLPKRHFSSMVLAIEEAQIDEAKTLIAEFNRKMSRLMTKSKKRDRVYCFSTQLFSLEESR
jgi:uncharacterized protein (TIGR02147 family)